MNPDANAPLVRHAFFDLFPNISPYSPTSNVGERAIFANVNNNTEQGTMHKEINKELIITLIYILFLSVLNIQGEIIAQERKPFHLAIKTNLAYDALLVPNIGIELYFGNKWSATSNWMYAWWESDRRHRYWRIYGGDLEIRHWFGRERRKYPLSGHHIGAYGQMVTYDIELGGSGCMGDKWSFGGGINYGYSIPLSDRLNMDFALGMGYFTGTYKEYLPIDNHYVWQKTRKLNWFGPTKAEVSLVWLIDRDNNRKKGSRR